MISVLKSRGRGLVLGSGWFLKSRVGSVLAEVFSHIFHRFCTYFPHGTNAKGFLVAGRHFCWAGQGSQSVNKTVQKTPKTKQKKRSRASAAGAGKREVLPSRSAGYSGKKTQTPMRVALGIKSKKRKRSPP